MADRKANIEKIKANHLKYAKLQKQADVRLKKRFNEYDRLARVHLDGLDREKDTISAEISKTHKSRKDDSRVYVGLVPGVKKPRVRPLPTDVEYIRDVMERRRCKMKKKEVASMQQLVTNIKEKLASMVEMYCPRTNTPGCTNDESKKKVIDVPASGERKRLNKPHFVSPIVETVQGSRAVKKKQTKTRQKDERQQTGEIIGGVREVNGEGEILSVRQDRGWDSVTEVQQPASSLVRKDEQFEEVYKECSRSRYLRTPSELYQ